MLEYDCSKPLIFCHVPKCGGLSVRNVFHRWFGKGLLGDYGKNTEPAYDISRPPFTTGPSVIFGHFNSLRGHGVEHLYPEIDQFMTILREPFEHSVSGYFYARKKYAEKGMLSKVANMSLEDYLASVPTRFFHQLPPDLRQSNFEAAIERQFVGIGLLEYLDQTLHRFAGALGFEYEPGSAPHLNDAERDDVDYQKLKSAFVDRHRDEYRLYDYIRAMYE